MAITDSYKLNKSYTPVKPGYFVTDEEALALLPAYREFRPVVADLLTNSGGISIAMESVTLRGGINGLISAAELAYESMDYDRFADWAVPHVDLPILRRWLDQLSGLV